MFEFLQKIFKSNLTQVQVTTGAAGAPDRVRAVAAPIPIDPVACAVLKKRGNAFLAQGQLEAAAACYQQASVVEPQDVFAWINLGFVLCEQGQLLQARKALHEALRLDPDQHDTHFMLGNVAQSIGDMSLATSHFREVLRLQPDFDFTAYFADETQYHQTVARYQSILSFDPQNAPVHMSLGMTSLLLGDHATGWREYHWRFRAPGSDSHPHKVFPQPLWLGAESIQGKTVLLHCEQGYGDTIQFCRYAVEVAELGAVVVLQVQRGLKELLKSLPGVTHLLNEGEPLPNFDLHCPLMSLPLALGHHRTGIAPLAKAYLQADPERMQYWRQRLAAMGSPRVGVVWSGNPRHGRDRHRSMTLSAFSEMLPPDMNVVCLQPEVREADMPVAPRIKLPGVELKTFADTAALVMALDLVISVDTSVVHLAGALGKPVWVLVSHVPDWRWQLDRQDTPWYPGARIFRQAAIEDWSRPAEEIRGALLQRYPAA